MESPDDNPKTAEGRKKPQLHLVPPIAIRLESYAFVDGAEKYGPYNWRDSKVSISTYISAARRHLDAFWDGEDQVPDSSCGAHHLAAVRACIAIILDAGACNMLNDDRPKPVPRPQVINAPIAPVVGCGGTRGTFGQFSIAGNEGAK